MTALAARSDGTLLAGSTPGGRIFAVDGRTGSSRPFAKLPAEHVWALLSDAKGAGTYAATGIPGQVFSSTARASNGCCGTRATSM